MKTSPVVRKLPHGLTLIEVLVTITVLAFIAALYLLPPLSRTEARSPRIQCVNNLKQVGLAFRVWEGDNGGDTFPMCIPQTNGGTMEFTSGPYAFRHFQVMSNELSTPKIVTCPA